VKFVFLSLVRVKRRENRLCVFLISSYIYRKQSGISVTFEKDGENDFPAIGMNCRVVRLSVLEWNISLGSWNNATFF
jgi:hypothetical protein